MAVTQPTLGAGAYADRLGDAGFALSKTTVPKILGEHGLSRRSQRVARAAAITAATTGLTTETVADDWLGGFCHVATGPGHLVALDSFYLGNLKGVGKLCQLSAVGTFTRWPWWP